MPDPCSLANRPKILLLVGVSLCDDGEVKKRSADSVGMNDPVWLCDKHFSWAQIQVDRLRVGSLVDG